MKIQTLAVMAAMVLGAGCQTDMPREEVTLCEDPRPQVCTREYRPVCAQLTGETTKTYANGCEACADKEVVSHRPGACE